jgi:hypothetical protein
MSAFARIIGIDYSGAETPTASLKGLRVYLVVGGQPPVEVPPPLSLRKYWTRKGIAEWLVERLAEDVPTLVGIDHGFSFPLRYFEAHGLSPDWQQFLDDFQRHWPTDEDHVYVEFVRDGTAGNGEARSGNALWRRLAEKRTRAKSLFHFDVQGSVAKSTHAGIPWLRHIRRQLGNRVHFWPFDGWTPPPGRSVVAEVYPSLWSKNYDGGDRTGDQHDAYSVAAALAEADRSGQLAFWLHPNLNPNEMAQAEIEGWILGVGGTAFAQLKQENETKPRKVSTAPAPTTQIGYLNRNNQLVMRRTNLPGNDHNQKVYSLECQHCRTVYGANGSDIWLRKCPSCQGGAAGLSTGDDG